MKCLLRSERGVLLAMTIVTIAVMMTLMSSLAIFGTGSMGLINSGFNNDFVEKERARVGITDADARVSADYTVGLAPVGSFTDTSYDPDPYYMDIDDFSYSDTRQSGSDVLVDIGPEVSGRRDIASTGLTN